MPSLISSPLSLILRGAEHLVVDCEPTLVYTQPPPLIFKGAGRQSYIVVTHEVEVTHEAGDAHDVKGSYEVKVTHKAEQQKYDQTPLNIDQLFHAPPGNPWKFCYVAAEKFETEDSNWGKITSTPGICVLGKRLDGFYKVAVDELYIPWLRRHNFMFLDKAKFEYLLCYDPTQPTEIKIEVYGGGRFYLHFLFGAIWSGRGPGLELCLRSIAPSNLQTALEWTILNCDILVSKPQVQKKFSLCLLFLALCLLRDYDTPLAIQLLEKHQNKVLQAFKKDLADLLMAALAQRHNYKADSLFIGFLRCLLILASGPKDLYQVRKLLTKDQEETAIDILNLCSSLLGVTGSNHFGNSDLQAMLNALSRSNVLTDEDISTLGVAELISQLMTLLPIGFQSDEVVHKLCVSSNIYQPHVLEEQSMKVSNTVPGSVYKLGKVYSDRKMGSGDNRPMTLFVDYDSLYKGTQRLSNEILTVFQTMKVGQKVLTTEDRNLEKEKEDGGEAMRTIRGRSPKWLR